MDAASYVGLTRQAGLLREVQVLAHNIANLSTTGFRREDVGFLEHVRAMPGGDRSLSMAAAEVRITDFGQGDLSLTGASFDFAIDGPGFFMVETPQGDRLTRAGHFMPSDAGELVTAAGHRVLDAGGGAIFVPPDAGPILLAADGTLATADGPIAQLAVVRPLEPETLRREAGQLFLFEGPVEPEPDARIRQGHLEGSNVDPVLEMARLITVQRAYELGQSFLEREDERIRGVVQTLGR